jgi:hypothetical protein
MSSRNDDKGKRTKRVGALRRKKWGKGMRGKKDINDIGKDNEGVQEEQWVG